MVWTYIIIYIHHVKLAHKRVPKCAAYGVTFKQTAQNIVHWLVLKRCCPILHRWSRISLSGPLPLWMYLVPTNTLLINESNSLLSLDTASLSKWHQDITLETIVYHSPKYVPGYGIRANNLPLFQSMCQDMIKFIHCLSGCVTVQYQLVMVLMVPHNPMHDR